MSLFSIERVLIDGTMLCVLMGVFILGSLYFNPRLWLQDYPAEIRALVPPQTRREKRIQYLVAIPFLLTLFGLPLYSAHLLRVANGGTLSFLSAYLNSFLILNIGNLFDALVIDYLILTVIQPKFALIPGAESMGYYLETHLSEQVRNYFKGVVLMTIFSLPLALVAIL